MRGMDDRQDGEDVGASRRGRGIADGEDKVVKEMDMRLQTGWL